MQAMKLFLAPMSRHLDLYLPGLFSAAKLQLSTVACMLLDITLVSIYDPYFKIECSEVLTSIL